MKTTLLAADTIHGVYEVKRIPPGVTLYTDDFSDVLRAVPDGKTVYLCADEAETAQIDDDYGITRLSDAMDD